MMNPDSVLPESVIRGEIMIMKLCILSLSNMNCLIGDQNNEMAQDAISC
jgi:hypothetical protein